MYTPSLFDQTAAQSLEQAFEHWLLERLALGSLRQPASIQVYRDMWNGFAVWCTDQVPAVTLTNMDVRDLQAFQAARFGKRAADLSLSPRHALRFLRLIDRVLRHHAAATGCTVNTAAADWIAAQPHVRFAESAERDPLPVLLSVAEAKHLITFLSAVRPRPLATQSTRDGQRTFTWQELRNRTAVALQLGAGLTPADVRALSLQSPTVHGGQVKGRPWKVAVPRQRQLGGRARRRGGLGR